MLDLLRIASAIPRSTTDDSDLPIQSQMISDYLRILQFSPEPVFTGAEDPMTFIGLRSLQHLFQVSDSLVFCSEL